MQITHYIQNTFTYSPVNAWKWAAENKACSTEIEI